jgi:hypothetical protein
MKKWMTLTVSLLFTSLTLAQALPSTLKDTMKAMNTDLRAIAAQVNNPQANAASADLADQFVQLVLHSKNFTPDTVNALPADQQAAALAQYNQMLDQVAAMGEQLANALRAGDNAQAAALITQLNHAKNDGHDQFNP